MGAEQSMGRGICVARSMTSGRRQCTRSPPSGRLPVDDVADPAVHQPQTPRISPHTYSRPRICYKKRLSTRCFHILRLRDRIVLIVFGGERESPLVELGELL